MLCLYVHTAGPNLCNFNLSTVCNIVIGSLITEAK